MSANTNVPPQCLDANAVCYEVVFAMPYTQKFATFRGQRKRFLKREHAEVFVKLHQYREKDEMKHAIIKGTMVEIDEMPNRVDVNALNALLNEPLDYGDGKMAHQCEWRLMKIDPKKPSDIKDIVNSFEPIVFGTKEQALACAKFMEHNCIDVIEADKQYAVAHMKLPAEEIDEIFIQKRAESK